MDSYRAESAPASRRETLQSSSPKTLPLDASTRNRTHMTSQRREDVRELEGAPEDYESVTCHRNSATLEWYGRMLRVFEPIRKTLAGRGLSLEQLISILNGGKSS